MASSRGFFFILSACIAFFVSSHAKAVGLSVYRAEEKGQEGELSIAVLALPYYRIAHGFDFTLVHLALAYKFDKTWTSSVLTGADRTWTNLTDSHGRFNVIGNYIKLAYLKANDLLGAQSISIFGLQQNPYYLLVEAPMNTTWIAPSLVIQTSMLGYFNAGVSTQGKISDALTYNLFIANDEGWLRSGVLNNGMSYAGFLSFRLSSLLSLTASDTLFSRSSGGVSENLVSFSANWTSHSLDALVETLWFTHPLPTRLDGLNGTLYFTQGPISALGYGITTRFKLVPEKIGLYFRFFSGNSDFQNYFLRTTYQASALGNWLFTGGVFYTVRAKEILTGVFYETLPLTATSASQLGLSRYNEIVWRWLVLF